MQVVYVQGMAVVPEALPFSCESVRDDVHVLEIARGYVEQCPHCFVPGRWSFAMEGQPYRPEYAVNTR